MARAAGAVRAGHWRYEEGAVRGAGWWESVTHHLVADTRDSTGAPSRTGAPDPLAARTPAELMETARQFREWAGRPSYREMAARCGHRAGASTMNTALRRDELPERLWLLDAIVEGCGGTEEDRGAFSTAWRLLTGNTPAGTGETAPGAGPAQGRPALRALRGPVTGGDDETGVVEAILRPAAGQAGRLRPQAPS